MIRILEKSEALDQFLGGWTILSSRSSARLLAFYRVYEASTRGLRMLDAIHVSEALTH